MSFRGLTLGNFHEKSDLQEYRDSEAGNERVVLRSCRLPGLFFAGVFVASLAYSQQPRPIPADSTTAGKNSSNQLAGSNAYSLGTLEESEKLPPEDRATQAEFKAKVFEEELAKLAVGAAVHERYAIEPAKGVLTLPEEDPNTMHRNTLPTAVPVGIAVAVLAIIRAVLWRHSRRSDKAGAKK